MIPAKPRTTTRPVAARTAARLKPDARLAPDNAEQDAPNGLGDTPAGAPAPQASIDALDGRDHQPSAALVRDGTDPPAAERGPADASDAALRASVVKSEFLATMSHDIRTPINGVIGSLELILDSELADDLRDFAMTASRSARDLLAIIDDMLDLEAAEQSALPAYPSEAAASTQLRGLRVLIAEDNPVNQLVLTRQAGRLGLVVTAVENGEAALGALADETYDAILMDCQMPVMDGYTAARAIRERERNGTARTPIVAVTANAMREDYDRCRDAGMDDFVTKPVTLTALADAIERAVAANRSGPDEPAAGPVQHLDAPQSDATSDDDLAIDRAALAALQEDLGGAAALARIVQMFLDQLDPQAAQIAQAAKDRDYEGLGGIAHRMKSSSATLGATTLAGVLEQIEAAASDRDATACEELCTSFTVVAPRTRFAFERVIAGLDAAS
jgi:CheY-like chemotaxis protein/HPt (histidine-containing phosphotransfer) domain-containing protein